ncbi:Gfo/Idh/MocA family oxidoreductase [Acinetobacter baumannii]|uniref:AciC n=1 Tax=Acinetobacter baumannii TaxID=470 RepID=A0A222URA5_ACIBA|nr:Gfo/Idh/MocA family oxidoreductase [Acinetobacter baumannii]ASR24080.1 AciC [Acinetobacter baumannii]MDW5369285.1 Gfo/Idh/MocA family oxidoreductase [Acinetobacter baumannii]MDW5384499.1 Gfo/Idh/MocA family oxidoreductase [Acinetobacter baumannii]MDW5412973.1 Gfo/Idh/MocA family oxidoreductase [Acinetobacter baumannii]MDW5456065.1 Gfo/Idh/MocA family oxidoreductase [Acinetobacter baumannii]
MVKLGIIGFSPENGHPYSFSSILNGYDRDAYLKTEWLGILNYLEKRGPEEIASLEARVTHIWTQSPELSKQIAQCSKIENLVTYYEDMIGYIDGVIIARDDYEVHKEIAECFLEKNIPVLIDKPLTLSKDELKWYKPFYEKGLIMSCSGFRYCKELDSVRESLESFGNIKLIRAAVINDWEKYGIHMLDATLGILDGDIVDIDCIKHNSYDSYFLYFKNNPTVQIDTLGPNIITFSYEIFGTKKCEKFEIRDNFTSFKRMLGCFIDQIKTKEPAISWDNMSKSISTLIAGVNARNTASRIKVSYE